MDKLNELSLGAKIALGAAIAFLVFSFFNWQEVDLGPLGEAGVSMWDGIGWIAGLLVIAFIVWMLLPLANVKLQLPVTPSMLTAAVAVLLLIFTVIKFLADNEFRTWAAWLGLILSIVIVVGAWLNMQAAGESLADVRAKMSSMTAGGGAAAPSPPPPPPPASEAAPPPPPAAPPSEQEEDRPSA